MHMIHQLELPNRSIAWSWSHGPVSRPLVVLHGLGDSSIETYAPLFRSTALRDIPALFIDLPGFGHASADKRYASTIEEMADDVIALLDHLAIAPTIFFGHSMGGNVLISLAYRYPERITTVIVAEPLLNPDHSVMASNITRVDESHYVQRRHQMLIRATEMQIGRGSAAAAAFLAPLRMAHPVAMYRAAVSLMTDRDPGMVKQLEQIECPTYLLIGGTTEFEPDSLGNLRESVYLVPNAGHSMFVEQPEATAYAILGIVSKAVLEGTQPASDADGPTTTT